MKDSLISLMVRPGRTWEAGVRWGGGDGVGGMETDHSD